MDLIKYFKIFKEIKKIIIFMTILFILFLIISLIYNTITYQNNSDLKESKEIYDIYLKVRYKETFIGNFFYVLIHNIFSSFLQIITGIAFAIFPLFIIIAQGISNGNSIIYTYRMDGLFYSLLIVPHSIFEIPSMIISCSLGIKIFLSLFKSKNRIKDMIQEYKNSIIVFLFIIIPLLIIASIIESLLIMIFIL